MTGLSPGKPGPDGEVNQILSGLLERLDEV